MGEAPVCKRKYNYCSKLNEPIVNYFGTFVAWNLVSRSSLLCS
jgi:hypothetical protein